MEWNDGVEAPQTRLAQLRSMAGGPSYARLEAAAKRIGVELSKSTVCNVLTGKSEPRWETIKAFIIACKYHAATSRPPMPLPAEAVDLAQWSAWYDRWRKDLSHYLAADGQTVLQGNIHTAMERVMIRFEDDPRSGGGYQYLLTPDFAAAA